MECMNLIYICLKIYSNNNQFRILNGQNPLDSCLVLFVVISFCFKSDEGFVA